MHPDLNPGGNIVRINPCLTPALDAASKIYKCPPVYDTDDTSRANFQTLLDMDMDAVEQAQVDLITELCDKFIVNDPTLPRLPNQLIRGDLKAAYLGQPYYKEARDKWDLIGGD